MRTPTYLIALRYAVAISVTAVIHVPDLLVGADVHQTDQRDLQHDEVVWFDFEPTLINYRVTVMGESPSKLTGGSTGSGTTMGTGGENSFDGRQTIIDSIIVAVGSTFFTIIVAVGAAYALSRMTFRAIRPT